MVIRRKPATTLPNGAIVPEREAYPSNSEWGRFGWSFPIRDREFVFRLAREMAGKDGPFGSWVHEQISAYKKTKRAEEVRKSWTFKP